VERQQTSKADGWVCIHFGHLRDPKWHRDGTETILPSGFVVVGSVVMGIMCEAIYQANPRVDPDEAISGYL